MLIIGFITLEFICGYIDQTLSWHNEVYELHASALYGWLVYFKGIDREYEKSKMDLEKL